MAESPSLPDWQTLSLAQQVAQLLVVRASGLLFDHQIRYPAWEAPTATLQQWITEWGVGGVILLGGSTGEISLRTRQLQAWATTPLLICADVEEGVEQRFSGATWFPPCMALGTIARQDLDLATHYAEQMGAITAAEAVAIGLNWILAPVVDVNNNPANPVINLRAFSDQPDIVSRLATAFIRGAHQHPVLTIAKHFPGHGDTAVDSHLSLPVIPHSHDRLREIELPPFQAAIAAGVDAVMTAHLLIPAWDNTYPATLSPRILTGELRQTMGFEGLIVTDALVMGAISDRYGPEEAAVLAVEAGADILIMPADPIATIRAICQAIDIGRIPPERIHASLARIWRAKQDLKHSAADLQTPASQHPLTITPALPLVQAILRDSMQSHRPQPCRLQQAKWQEHPRNLLIVDDSLNCKEVGHYTPAIAVPKQLGYTLQLVDRHTPTIVPTPKTQPWQPTLLQLFIRSNPFRDSTNLTQIAWTWLEHLLATDALQALVLYGTPYILEKFTAHLPADVPYCFTYGQMPQAQAVIMDRLFENHAPMNPLHQ